MTTFRAKCVKAVLFLGIAMGWGGGYACAPAPMPSSAPPTGSSARARPPGATDLAPPSTPASTSASDREDIAPEAATGFVARRGVSGTGHMIAAANPYATRAGRTILRQGGSAVDAAIAAALVLTLVEPQSSGIGGGAFLLHHDAATRTMRAFDGRETAPAAATPDMFLARGGTPKPFFDAVVGGLSVGVPGALRMFELAHRREGKLPWAALFAPAIRLCDDGFDVSPRLHALLARDPVLRTVEPTRSYFYGADGAPKPAGTRLANPELAAVLRTVAAEGASAFYRGVIADDIVRAVRRHRRNPGRLTSADLAGYAAREREPVCLRYRGRHQICGMPPPTSGGITTLQILGLLEHFDLGSEPGSSHEVHLFAEAGRLAFADRGRYLADPDFEEIPVAGLLDPGYLARRSEAIRVGRVMPTAPPGVPPGLTAEQAHWADDDALELPSTSHLVVVDGNGDAVSMTASIETAFGSHVMVRGFLLNNELTDFSFTPERDGRPVANRVAPNKRPRSSMAPILVLDEAGNVRLAVGSPGGSRIIPYVARTLVAMLDHGVEPQAAVAGPNFGNRGGATEIERHPERAAWVATTRATLTRWGHDVRVVDMNSGLHVIERRPDGRLRGGADPRREGMVMAD